MDGGVAVIAGLAAAVDGLLDLDVTALAASGVSAALVELERQRRRLAAVEHRLIREVDERRLDGAYGRQGVADLLSALLRIDPRAARERAAQADDLTPGRNLQGDALPPRLPATAEAVRLGAISPEHVTEIARAMGRIPAGVDVEGCEVAERVLVAAACHQHPRALQQTAALLLERLDPDGQEPREEQAQARRSFTLTPRPDGTVKAAGTLTGECAAVWEAVLGPLAAPAPAADGIRDERSPAQRRHDGLLEAGLRLLRSGTLPDAGGTPVTVVIRTTDADVGSPGGIGHTASGDVVPLVRLRPLLGDTAFRRVTLDRDGAVLSCGRTVRTATTAQRHALAVRDGGCCFPHCDRPAAWCEVHHIVAWALGGATDLDNLCLLCSFHHRTFEQSGWQVIMRDGRPWWVPPALVDPDRRPVRNIAAHPTDVTSELSEIDLDALGLRRPAPAGAAPARAGPDTG